MVKELKGQVLGSERRIRCREVTDWRLEDEWEHEWR
jgi:hypothetical protein